MRLCKRGLTTLLLCSALAACSPPAPQVDCPEISRGCKLDGLTVSTSQPPQIMQPFQLVLQWEPSEAEAIGEVHASFAMEGMEMGLNRYRLVKKSDGLWQAEITLPLCVRGRADWMMQIDAKTRFGSKQYRLGFYTG
jgi:hypothetical protein